MKDRELKRMAENMKGLFKGRDKDEEETFMFAFVSLKNMSDHVLASELTGTDNPGNDAVPSSFFVVRTLLTLMAELKKTVMDLQKQVVVLTTDVARLKGDS